jgi:hypothetical protein
MQHEKKTWAKRWEKHLAKRWPGFRLDGYLLRQVSLMLGA